MSQRGRAPDQQGSAHDVEGGGDVSTLRVVACGSVDDGKSTLIGRLLYEQSAVPDDQLDALARESQKPSGEGEGLDFAMLLDGLEAEREQGITIDVAYRYFSTARRSFIIADAPGHEQYTRNMATAAANADLALILVDAGKGLTVQTFRHAVIASLFGVRQAILVINKIDLIAFDQAKFDDVVSQFTSFANKLNFSHVRAIPVSARHGDNVSSRSARTAWYNGPHLLDALESAASAQDISEKPFRMIVQWVNRRPPDFRGLSGQIVSGRIRKGDEVVVACSGRATKVACVLAAGGEAQSVEAGEAATLVLADQIDVARGDVLVGTKDRPQVADQFAAHIIWMNDEPLLPGRSYLMKIGTRTLPAAVTELKHRLDVNTLGRYAAKTLTINEIGLCNVAVSSPVAFDPYDQNTSMGSFILIDRFSNATAAAGMIMFGLRRATNIHHADLTVTKAARAELKRQRPAVLWFTGLSGAGKSTIADMVEARLHARGAHTILLDGDNLRHGLNRDLGFTDADRVENIRRVAEVAKLMTQAGLIVLCSFISPFRAERRAARDLIDDDFIEIFVDTPLDQCIARDPKGLYRRALAGEIKNITGLDQPYEAPERAEIHLDAGRDSPQVSAERVLAELLARAIV